MLIVARGGVTKNSLSYKYTWRCLNIIKTKELKKYLASLEKEIRLTQLRVEKELKKIDLKEQDLNTERQRVLDRYITGNLDRGTYTEKCLSYDIETNKIKLDRTELIKRIPILHKADVIDANLRVFCETAKLRLDGCKDFNDKRRFFLDFLEEIIYDHGKVTIRGSVPIRLKAYEDPDQTSAASKIGFQ